MKRYYFKGPVINFGDDLNEWLWPQLIPEIGVDDASNTIFLGIGSILYDSFPPEARKVVLGSGYGGYTARPTVDERWNFYFVRGPRTAAALGLDPNIAVTDAAILLRTVRSSAQADKKRYPVSFMPHWESAQWGDWSEVTEAAGVHYIDPRSSVESTLEQLASTELLITEAMHGAIVADALRVPWVPVTPTNPQHNFKWHDWCESLGIDYQPNRLGASSAPEYARLKGIKDTYRGRFLYKFGSRKGSAIDSLFKKSTARNLKELKRARPSLSADATCQMRTEQAVAKLDAFRADYRQGRYS